MLISLTSISAIVIVVILLSTTTTIILSNGLLVKNGKIDTSLNNPGFAN